MNACTKENIGVKKMFIKQSIVCLVIDNLKSLFDNALKLIQKYAQRKSYNIHY